MKPRLVKWSIALAIACVVARFCESNEVCAQGTQPDSVVLAAQIDQWLEEYRESHQLPVADRTDDATFVRRVSLDLLGRIPTVSEANAFRSLPQERNRFLLVEELTRSAEHDRFLASTLRRIWFPQLVHENWDDAELLDRYLAERLSQGFRYDQLVKELMRGDSAGEVRSASASRYLLTLTQGEPAKLAATTTRSFLGLNLDCAECHDHPFAEWSQEQFWGTAAFFAQPSSQPNDSLVRPQIKMPGTEHFITAALPTGERLDWPDRVTHQTGPLLLSDWLTDPGNKYFALHASNQIWYRLIGKPLAEPMDNLSSYESSDYAPLLEILADSLVEHEFDVKYLVQAIVLSDAYQRSSHLLADTFAANSDLLDKGFGRMAVRGLTGDQLYRSLRVAAGLPKLQEDLESPQMLESRRRFLVRFQVADPTVANRSIVQSLTLMNGEMMDGLTDPEQSPILKVVINAPFLERADRVEQLYWAALGRAPTNSEYTSIEPYLIRKEAEGAEAAAYGSLFWALLNSSEFNSNH